MAFGLSAGAATLLGSVAAPVIGGLIGSEGSSSGSTQRTQRDPRIDRLLFGDDPNQLGGLLARVQAHADANPTSMNQQMIDGMNQRWNTATDPSIRAGFQNQRQTGNALMSSPIAGNPFTREGGYSRDMFGGGQPAPQMPQVRQRNPNGGIMAPAQGGYGPGINEGILSANTPAPQQQPAGQFGPPPGYNPSQQTPSDIAGLYASIGRTGENAPNAQEIAYWRNTGLAGDQLRNRFLQEAANYRGGGYDANKQQARGLLGTPMPGTNPFRQPATPAPTPAPSQTSAAQQSDLDKLLAQMNVSTY